MYKGKDSKGSAIRIVHSKGPCCRRGALKRAALEERRAGFRGFGAILAMPRVTRCCAILGFLIGHASEGAPPGDRRIGGGGALCYPGCAQEHMKVPHSVQGGGSKGSTLRAHFEGRVQVSCYLLPSCVRAQRKSGQGAVHCCIQCSQVVHCAKECLPLTQGLSEHQTLGLMEDGPSVRSYPDLSVAFLSLCLGLPISFSLV